MIIKKRIYIVLLSQLLTIGTNSYAIIDQAVFYGMGIVTKPLVEDLAMDALNYVAQMGRNPKDQTFEEQELAKRISKSTEQDKKNWAKALSVSIMTGLKKFIGSSINAESDPKTAMAFASAFDAGSKFRAILAFVEQSGSQLYNLSSSTYQVGKQMALMVYDQLKATNPEAANWFKTYRSDLFYPVVFTTHTTRLDCGIDDPYCLRQEKRSIEDDWKKAGYVSSPDDFVLALNKLVTHGGTFAVGLGIAIVSHQLAVTASPVIAASLLQPAVGSLMSGLMAKGIERYLTLTVMDQLRSWFITLATHTFMVPDTGAPTEKEMEQLLKLGYKEQVVEKGAIPLQTKFINDLFSGAS